MAANIPDFHPAKVVLQAISSKKIDVSQTRWDLIAKRILDSNCNNIEKVTDEVISSLKSKQLTVGDLEKEGNRLIKDLSEIALFLKDPATGEINKTQRAILESLTPEVQDILKHDSEKITEFISRRQKN